MRSNFALGTRPTVQESGLGGLPIEADMRYSGGFMPYGAKEKADDVPARLSKNEFVFTADAVRAAGGGSINKGAKRMYNTMKQLESMGRA
jgi:predicted house-cleaning NTP pyrophosphatase (Maf/HAM1 superfamily)